MNNRSTSGRKTAPRGGAGSSAETKTLLLDAAERLFASRGYRETSLRTLTAHAGVNLAAVNYHFGTKEALLVAVLARRLDALNRVRMERLRKIRTLAERQKTPPSVAEILRAFIAPMFFLRDAGKDAPSFTVLVGRILTDHDSPTKRVFLKYMKPVFIECHGLLCRALPDLPPKTVFWRLLFATAAASRVMRLDDSMMQLDAAYAQVGDTEDILALLLPFVTAGMEAQ